MYRKAACLIEDGWLDLMKTWLYPLVVPSMRTLRVRFINSVLYPRAFFAGVEVTERKPV
jgi:hypothetical protein